METLGLDPGILFFPLTMLRRSCYGMDAYSYEFWFLSTIFSDLGICRLLTMISLGAARPRMDRRRSEVEVIPSVWNSSSTSSLVGWSSSEPLIRSSHMSLTWSRSSKYLFFSLSLSLSRPASTICFETSTENLAQVPINFSTRSLLHLPSLSNSGARMCQSAVNYSTLERWRQTNQPSMDSSSTL